MLTIYPPVGLLLVMGSPALAQEEAVATNGPFLTTPATAAYESPDGFRFPTAEAANCYALQRIVLQVLDARRGVWAASGAAAVSASAGVDVHVESGASLSTVKPQYRFATGEGVVVAELNGETLYDGRRLFVALGDLAAYEAHSHVEGEPLAVVERQIQKKSRFTVAGAVSGAVLTGAVVWTVASVLDEEKFAAPLATSLVATASTITFVTAANRTVVPTLERRVLDPWLLDELLPHVRRYNTKLRQECGVLP